VAFKAYFAITANTVQFGARLELEANALGFTAEGHAGLDVLFQFNPFRFQTDLSLGMSLRKGDWYIAGVSLDLGVTGPKPWILDGEATFEFLEIQKKFPVHAVLGEAEKSEKPKIDVGKELLLPALERPDAWKPRSGSSPGVRLRDVPAAEGEVWVLPDGGIDLRQSVAPLGVTLEQYGNSAVTGETRFAITGAKLGGTPCGVDPVEDWFALSQFLVMSDEEKLSAPSFESLDCGVCFGADEAAGGEARDLALDYEEIVWDPKADGPRLTRDTGQHPLDGGVLEREVARAGAKAVRKPALMRLSGPAGGKTGGVRIEPARFTVTSRLTGEPAADAQAVRYVAARETLKKHGAGARRLQIQPHAATEEV
jgi:hypothetical protein